MTVSSQLIFPLLLTNTLPNNFDNTCFRDTLSSCEIVLKITITPTNFIIIFLQNPMSLLANNKKLRQ